MIKHATVLDERLYSDKNSNNALQATGTHLLVPGLVDLLASTSVSCVQYESIFSALRTLNQLALLQELAKVMLVCSVHEMGNCFLSKLL